MRRPFRRLRLSFLSLSAVLLAPAAQGLTFVKAADEYLADRAAVIVRAVVRPVESEPAADGMPTTLYALEVKAALHGASVGEILELEMPGGFRGDGSEVRIPGLPRLRGAEEALLFLARTGTGRLQPLHLNQGWFRIETASGGRRAARRSFEGTTEILPGNGLESAPGAAERPRDLALFEAWIADRLAGRRRPANYQLAEGLEAAPAPYTLSIWDGRTARWQKGTSPLGITYLAHEVPQPGLASGGYDEVIATLEAWNGLEGGNLRLRYGGLTDAVRGTGGPDGVTAIVFDAYGGSTTFTPFDCAAGAGALALGTFAISGYHNFAGGEAHTIVEGDVVTNKNLHCWSLFTPANFLHTIAHEVGHTLGLEHSCGDSFSGPCDSPEERQAVMHAYHDGDNRGARLSEDDRRAIAFLYGPPAAPASLRAQLDAANRVQLSWPDTADNESGYRIFRGPSGGELTEIGAVGSGVRGIVDAGTEPATTYRYQVRAENENGASPAAETSITTASLDAPTQLAATAAGSDRIALAWVDKAGNEMGYEVWGRFLGSDELLATLPANSQAATLENLIADSTYSFKVRATGLPTGSTAFSNTASSTTLPAPIEPCAHAGEATCLGAERFKVEVRWKDFGGQRGEALVAPAGSADSGIFYFFSPNNWEMLVKVLDGCSINQQHWVFAAGTTDVETTLIVTDSQTGKTAVYYNPLGTPAPAITDIEAFSGCAETSARAATEPELAAAATGCDGTPGNLCLLGGRYDVAVTWTDFAGVSGSGQAVPAGTADSGLFYFFSPDNWEMLVKVLDGCAINQQHWVFAAATTNVAYTLTVTDTDTGAERIYENPLGQASAAITDIAAFEACRP